MEIEAVVEAPTPVARVYDEIRSLDGYPQWIGIVHAVQREAEGVWQVELRGKVGPFARSKRLRMVRVVDDAPCRAVFERQETDGRRHAAWKLTASVEEVGGVSRLTMHLHYGGALFGGGVLEKVLGDQIAASKEKLLVRLGA
jgi:uncharacterized protein YndB with AHSA1/START domain